MGSGGMRPGGGRRRRVQTAAERARVIPIPPPPEDLDERAAAAWRAHAAMINPLEIYTQADGAVFRLWARMQAKLEAVLAGELTERDRDGNPAPASLAATVALTRCVAMLAGKFKADPTSRGAVPAAPAPEAAENDPDAFDPLPPEVVLIKPH